MGCDCENRISAHSVTVPGKTTGLSSLGHSNFINWDDGGKDTCGQITRCVSLHNGHVIRLTHFRSILFL